MRTTRLLTLSATAALATGAVSACAGAASDTTTPTAADTGGEPAGNESVADDTVGGDVGTTPNPTPEPAPELNCLSVLSDDAPATESDQAAWGLKEQHASTGLTYTPYLGPTPSPEATQSITAERGVTCLAYGENTETGTAWEYVEFDPAEAEAIHQQLESMGGETFTTEQGDTAYFQGNAQPGAGGAWQSAIVVGDGWLGRYVGQDAKAGVELFTAEPRQVDANEAITDEALTFSCSMFLPPSEGEAQPLEVKFTGFRDFYTFEQEPPDPYFAATRGEDGTDVGCDRIIWHEGDEQPPEGELVEELDDRQIYEVGSGEYVVVFNDGGWLELTAAIDYAKVVMPPEFRGLPADA